MFIFMVFCWQMKYHNMVEGDFEPELHIAIEIWRGQNERNQQLSRLIDHFPVLGMAFDIPPGAHI
jgi:hypothetical protein